MDATTEDGEEQQQFPQAKKIKRWPTSELKDKGDATSLAYQCPSDLLPDELWVAVFALLEPIHAPAVTLTCRRWRDVFHADPPLWRVFHAQLLGGPLVPAVLDAPALPDYYSGSGSCLTTACPGKAAGQPLPHALYRRRMAAMRREAWFGPDEWRAAVEWKVRRVREWGVSPEGRLEWAARLGCPRLVAALLTRYGRELSTSGRVHVALTLALRAAAAANDLDSVKMFLVRGADPNGLPEASIMMRRPQDFGLKSDTTTTTPPPGLPPMLEAARWGNAALTRLLLQHGARPQLAHAGSETPLLVACSAGHAEVVALLLDYFGFVCGFISGSPHAVQFSAAPDCESRSALGRASRGGHLGVVRLFVPDFLYKLAPWEASNALWSAAKEGHHDVMDYLLDHGVAVTCPSPIITYARLPRGPGMRATTLMRLIKAVPDVGGEDHTECDDDNDGDDDSNDDDDDDDKECDHDGGKGEQAAGCSGKRVWARMPCLAWEVYTAPGLSADERAGVYALLRARGADINATCFVPGVGTTSPLRHAVAKGDAELVAALLRAGADPRRLPASLRPGGAADPARHEHMQALLCAHIRVPTAPGDDVNASSPNKKKKKRKRDCVADGGPPGGEKDR